MTKPNANQIIAVVLMAIVLHNSYLHYTHPAYTYYRENVQQFRADYNAFRKQVIEDFVPAITNVSIRLASASSVPQPTNSFSSVSSSPAVKPSPDKVKFSELQASYFVCNGEKGFYFEGFPYFLGDVFMGGEVILITPSFVQTTISGYILRKPQKGTSYAQDSFTVR